MAHSPRERSKDHSHCHAQTTAITRSTEAKLTELIMARAAPEPKQTPAIESAKPCMIGNNFRRSDLMLDEGLLEGLKETELALPSPMSLSESIEAFMRSSQAVTRRKSVPKMMTVSHRGA
mmetsp:Transcript_8123/g.20313  ORF Transcript_8123/g.20313 Transcript_8123/m.20313 type:complete len:120 (-) Transcript_8123:655-1014(-)